MNRLLVIALAGALALSAQTNRGSISGTVTDQTQGVIPAATVTVTDVGTNEIRKVSTSESGSYAVPNLEPVTYRIEVESKGFRKEVVQNVKVDTAANTTVNVTLQAGSVDT
ncbi:MAG TPA: carboxypeptidase-like regulatory domain-containing protein, partial [Xanthobacteraceae bacterium]|nr:carboxypeptidase-like regulatory domain-containing protein [Xanthobacteraceae bacterium]